MHILTYWSIGWVGLLLAERQNNILEQLNIKGKIYAAELAIQLNVSEDTIRRDLNKMGEEIE